MKTSVLWLFAALFLCGCGSKAEPSGSPPPAVTATATGQTAASASPASRAAEPPSPKEAVELALKTLNAWCTDSHCERGFGDVRPEISAWSHPEPGAPAGGIRLPVAREDARPERAGPGKGGGAAAPCAGTLAGAEHSGRLRRRRADAAPSAGRLHANKSSRYTWQAAQNGNVLADYLALYDPAAFRGVTRTTSGNVQKLSFADWKEQRSRSFGPKLGVAADAAKTVTWTENPGLGPGVVEIRFTQRWTNGKYADHGPKVMHVRVDKGVAKIIYEELLSSEPGWALGDPTQCADRPVGDHDGPRPVGEGRVRAPGLVHRRPVKIWPEAGRLG